MLEEFYFRDIELFPAKGHWRTSRFADVMPWEGRGIDILRGGPVNFGCWETMTECVRHGIVDPRKQHERGSFFEIVPAWPSVDRG